MGYMARNETAGGKEMKKKTNWVEGSKKEEEVGRESGTMIMITDGMKLGP